MNVSPHCSTKDLQSSTGMLQLPLNHAGTSCDFCSENGMMETKSNCRDGISQNVYAVVRHADRSDCTWDSSLAWTQSTEFKQCASDPPLSVKGLLHAKSVGESLRSEIQMKDLERMFVISSPYLRCVQTATEICRAFEKSSIYIDNQIGEIWHPDVVGQSAAVRPGMQAGNWCQERGIQIIGDPLGSWPTWLEEHHEARTRYALRFLQYMQLSQTGSVFVLVTHADGVGSMLRTLPEHARSRVLQVEYCGLFKAWRTSCITSSSCIQDVWQVKTQGISVCKSSNDIQTPKQSVEGRNSSDQEFSLQSKCKTIDLIKEALSAGNWPATPKNNLVEKDFFNSLGESLSPLMAPETLADSPSFRIRKWDSSPAVALVLAQEVQTASGKKGLAGNQDLRTTSEESFILNPESRGVESKEAHLAKWLRWLSRLKTANELQKLFSMNRSKVQKIPETIMSPINHSGSGLLLRRRRSQEKNTTEKELQQQTQKDDIVQPQQQIQQKQQSTAVSETWDVSDGKGAKVIRSLVALNRKVPRLFACACFMLAWCCLRKFRSYLRHVRAFERLTTQWKYTRCL